MLSPDSRAAEWTIVPQGDRCLLLMFGDRIDVEVGLRCARAAAALRTARIEGVTDIVPSFTAVAVHYRPGHLGAAVSYDRLSADIEQVLLAARRHDAQAQPGKQVDIPVCYGGEYGPDLADVARHCGLESAEVVALHSGSPAYVFMLGFAPGAPYIGVHDSRLSIGRRQTPRTLVPAGSVGIANLQTMIYPNASPGGWNIIGATPVALFDPEKDPAVLLEPGDTVRFVPISNEEFLALQGRRA